MRKFKIFKITVICMENHASVTGWQKLFFSIIQMLLTFGGRYSRYFWDIRLKILRLPNFNILFQLVLLKFFKSELFSCIPKVDHVITVMQRGLLLRGTWYWYERWNDNHVTYMGFFRFCLSNWFLGQEPVFRSPDNLSSPKSNEKK